MASGGARSRSGPPPDPNALRRSRKSDPAWTKVPARHDIATPAWPLEMVTERELEVWESTWRHPVATIWTESHALLDVAFFVRMFCEAEQPKARAEDRKTVVQMMANLYLTADSQLRARILIEDADEEPVAVETPTTGNVTDLRSRLSRADSA